jgi:hypothetical protein
MAQRRLQNVLGEFQRNLREARSLAIDAEKWSSPAAVPHISLKRRDSMLELAFLRTYLAWESFLEESFILYLLGQPPPRGRAPHRFAYPPNRKFAEEWIVNEGREFASWGKASTVSSRAERFFRGGRPYSTALRPSQHVLDETRTIRNAVAHSSSKAVERFEKLVRSRLGTLPPNATIGGFLATVVPSTTPPMSFFELYVKKIEVAATRIVPG